MYLESLFSLAGKTALVTGGATGIGRMIAEALARAGARVMIASRKREACEAAAESLNAVIGTSRAEGIAGDVATEDGVEALAADIARRMDRLHILVNNAGKTWGAPLNDFPYKAWDIVLSVNVTGPFALTQRMRPLLEAAATDIDPARIVNLGSVAGLIPIVDDAYSYAASKAAIHHLTRVLAKDLAPRITVNALAPGLFESKMTAFSLKDRRRAEAMASRIPARRIGAPSDIAASILYLCGPGGAYTTGAVLPVDGGVSVQTGPGLFAGD